MRWRWAAEWRRCWPWLAVLLAAWAAQGFAWRAAFYMDDFHHILMREEVTGAKSLEWEGKGRALTFALWRAIYALWGPNPVAFHGLNWFLHGVVAVLSFWVLRGFALLGPAPVKAQADSVAWWGALVFAVHPLAVEPVHYAAQTTLLLATALAMAAAGTFLRWKFTHRLRWLGLSLLLVVLAGMAKQPGIWHALILLFFLAWLPGPKSEATSPPARTRAWTPRQRLGVLFLGGGLLVLLVQTWLGLVLDKLGDPTALTYHWLTQARVLGEYVSRMWVPLGLCSDHHVAWTMGWSDTEAVLKLGLVVVGALWILERTLRGRRWVAALMGLCFFHLLLRFAYPLDEPMVEYRTYPSLPWLGLILVWSLREVTEWRFPRLAWLARPAMAVILISFSLLSWKRSQVWQNEQRLAMDVLHQYPLNLRAMGIYFKNLVWDGQMEAVMMGADMPRMVSERILSHNQQSDRAYSERRLHLDYASCQYYIVRAFLHAGEREEALARAEALLEDLITGRRVGGPDSFFTALLSRALCYQAFGDEEEVGRTWEMARPLVPDAESLPEVLEAEWALLDGERFE